VRSTPLYQSQEQQHSTGRVGENNTGDIVDYHRDAGVANVRGYQRAEAFLTSRIPELEADGSVFKVHCLVHTQGAPR